MSRFVYRCPISVAAFEFQHTISKAFGYKGDISYMHQLHIKAKEEIEKESPNIELIDTYLAMMEDEARDFKANP